MKRMVVQGVAVFLLSLVTGATLGAPDGNVPVAPGFPDWENVSEKNWLKGRKIEPSDLRHKVVVVCVVDASKFDQEQAFRLSSVARGYALPQFSNWDVTELPRNTIVVFSVRGDFNQERFDAVWQKPKDEDAAAAFSNKMSAYGLGMTSFYRELKQVGEPAGIADHCPYVYVLGGEGTDPVYAQGDYVSAKHAKALAAAVKKGVAALPEWRPRFGVADPQYFKDVVALVEKGKPVQAALKTLQRGIASKDEAQAREAQIMYDALVQHKGDLRTRVLTEFRSAPARAYVDMNELIRMFPSEKKKLQNVETVLKANKNVGVLGKILEKVMSWERPDFRCKNAGEAKKITVELQKMKKTVDLIAESKNAALQGEALLLQSRAEALIAEMPDRVGANK